MDAGTSSSPVFIQTADELVKRLERDGSEAAGVLVREASELAACFRRWQTEKPDQEARVVTIQRLLDLQRRAMTYLSASRPP